MYIGYFTRIETTVGRHISPPIKRPWPSGVRPIPAPFTKVADEVGGNGKPLRVRNDKAIVGKRGCNRLRRERETQGIALQPCLCARKIRQRQA